MERLHVEKAAPAFFVSVASKRLSQTVGLLFATLVGRSTSVAAKGLIAVVGSDPTGSGQALFAEAETEGMRSEGRAAGSKECGIAMAPSSPNLLGAQGTWFTRGKERADKGKRSFLRRTDNRSSITQEVLDVDVYLVCNFNNCGRC
jgi:hypothetical protein